MRVGRLALVLAFVLFAGAVRADPATPPNATIVANFDVIGFGGEYSGRRYDGVRKWAGPVRVGIQGKGYPEYFEAMVRQHVDDLKAIAGHPIELYYTFAMQKAKTLPQGFDRKKLNVVLYYLPRAEIPKAIAKYYGNDEAQVTEMVRVSTCFAKIFTKGFEIRAAVVVFPAEHPKDYIRACVVEELTQILGLANDYNKAEPSIFNDKSPYTELTEHDRLMLRMLYDKRMPIGMPRAQALKTGLAILNELRPAGK